MRRRSLLGIGGILASLLLICCGGGGGNGPGPVSDTTPPTVSSTSPADGATGVPVDSLITAAFSETVDPSTINSSTFILSSGGGTVTCNTSCGGQTATLTPMATLQYDTTYTATITTGVRDLAGNTMSSQMTWEFTTATQTKILTGLTINGPSSVNENSTATYTATASWSDGSTSSVNPSWAVNPKTYASIDASGVLTTLPVPNDQTVFIGAAYSNGGITETASKTVTILDAGGANVSISGKIRFESVPTTQSNGLDYSNITNKPCRGIVVEAIKTSNNAVIFSTSTDSSGDYTVSVPTNTEIFLRFKAQMVKTGSPSWDFRIVDNTKDKSLYVAVGPPFDSGTDNITNKNYYMPCGWGGTSYTSGRVAAPFAILDTVYQVVDKITQADPTIVLPMLLINWSVNNINTPGDKTIGQIGGPHYDFSERELYLLGFEDNDTDEYDDHVIVHELGHYLEDRLARSDSTGGPHSVPVDKLDPRLAFGEGFGSALSGMITDDPNMINTGGPSQALTILFIDLEDNTFDESNEGWFSEISVAVILYDLYDGVNDGADAVSLGFPPIYDVLVGKQKSADSFTTIFSFLSFLKEENPSDAPAINNLVSGENITTSAVDEWDSTGTETNDGGNPKSLPVYTKLTLGAPDVPLCSTGQFGHYNKLMNRKYFYFDITSSGIYSISAVPDSDGGPLLNLYLKGNLVGEVTSGTYGYPATLTLTLSPGSYVGEVFDHNIVNNNKVSEECFDVSLN